MRIVDQGLHVDLGLKDKAKILYEVLAYPVSCPYADGYTPYQS